MNYQPIENYGIIGNLHTVALVGLNGSIDFMCFPKFDSPTIFARLLDHDRGGHFSICPSIEKPTERQLYLPDTNILFTRFLADTGVAEICDFMPIESSSKRHQVVRRVTTIKGDVCFTMECKPSFDYGRSTHTIERTSSGIVFNPEKGGQPPLRLISNQPLQIDGERVICHFQLHSRQSAEFILEEIQQSKTSPVTKPNYGEEALMKTAEFWRNWLHICKYKGRWREQVYRSALTLKLLTYDPTGAIVAAPTFGLPERIGGSRNWDYRYTWIRDASFTMNALMLLGYYHESTAFMNYLENTCIIRGDQGPLHIMYGIHEQTKMTEYHLDHFEGYKGSKPVRIGNAAYDQLQLDIYGELMDAIMLFDSSAQPIHHDLWQDLLYVTDWVVNNWQQADEGIWEIRSGRKNFLYSRVMCWVALDRAIKLAIKRSFPAPLTRLIKVRDMIYADIYQNFWSKKRHTFVQTIHSDHLDASLLRMPLVNFISPTDPRWLSTLRAIDNELVDDALIFRYHTEDGEKPFDGLAKNEGTFSMCTFWLVECLAKCGDLRKARFIFEKMLSYANHLNLFSEELSQRGEHLGNFPQAFTQLGLISAAYTLDHLLDADKSLRE